MYKILKKICVALGITLIFSLYTIIFMPSLFCIDTHNKVNAEVPVYVRETAEWRCSKCGLSEKAPVYPEDGLTPPPKAGICGRTVGQHDWQFIGSIKYIRTTDYKYSIVVPGEWYHCPEEDIDNWTNVFSVAKDNASLKLYKNRTNLSEQINNSNIACDYVIDWYTRYMREQGYAIDIKKTSIYNVRGALNVSAYIKCDCKSDWGTYPSIARIDVINQDAYIMTLFNTSQITVSMLKSLQEHENPLLEWLDAPQRY